MIRRIPTAALLAALVSAGLSRAAAECPAEEAVRNNRPAEALTAAPGKDAAETDYWQAQALLRLGRVEEAAERFGRVPTEHPLYPYAARGLLYCAWVSPEIDLKATCDTLIDSPHGEIARLALAMLAEHCLRYTNSSDTTTLPRLEKICADYPEYYPLVKLLTLHTMRHAGEYDKALEYAKNLEHETDLSPIMRQRLRLDIAELYYDKEKKALPETAGETEESTDDGKGEETLLQFITANPDSPLLEEAFRRLHEHGAIGSSDYTLSRLQEWAADPAHPHRAVLALAAQQQVVPDSTTLANRAASELPLEPTTVAIIHEQLRRMYARNRDEQAASYLALLNTMEHAAEAPLTLFARGRSAWQDPRTAMLLFLRCAEQADAKLRPRALANALICAMRAGDEDTVQQLLHAPATPATRRELLMAHAAYMAESDSALARLELAEVLGLSPTPEQATDVLLDRAMLSLKDNPEEALATLLGHGRDKRRSWTDAQALRYAGLLEKAAELTQRDPLPLLHTLYKESETAAQREGLALHIADCYVADNHHRRALQILLELAQQQPVGEKKAITLFYAARESAALATLPALKHAAQLYAECARQGRSLAATATISQAAILVRINRTEEAFDLLYRLQQEHPTLTAEEQALMLTVQADAYGLLYTTEGFAKALECSAAINALPGISQAWQARALLQHALLNSRQGDFTAALEDYRKVIHSEGQRANPAEAHSCFIYYYAGAGAVYELLQLERPLEAAELAESIAAWPGQHTTPGPQGNSFALWAQNIRRTYHLPERRTESTLPQVTPHG